MKKLVLFVCFSVFLIGFKPACAADYFVNAGMSFGGDDVEYTMSGDTVPISDTIFAGGGFILNPLGEKFEIQIGAYYSLGSASTGGVDYQMTQVSIESLFCFVVDDFRLGAGAVYYPGGKMELSDSISTDKYDFESSLGYVISFDYFFVNKDTGRLSVGAKYTKVDFEMDGGPTWKGDNLSFSVGLYF